MTPAELIAAHDVLWSIDGHIQCRCKALMRRDVHAVHVVAQMMALAETSPDAEALTRWLAAT